MIMNNLNPYAAPAAANEPREAPYARFVSCGYSATIAGACFVLLIMVATRSGLWTAAAAFLSLELHFLQAGIIAWLTQTLIWSEPGTMEHRKVSMPEPRHQSRYRTSTAGYTRDQVLFCLTGILGAHVILVILYGILYGLFGAAEPKW
jgi:hypothetical protein